MCSEHTKQQLTSQVVLVNATPKIMGLFCRPHHISISPSGLPRCCNCHKKKGTTTNAYVFLMQTRVLVLLRGYNLVIECEQINQWKKKKKKAHNFTRFVFPVLPTYRIEFTSSRDRGMNHRTTLYITPFLLR